MRALLSFFDKFFTALRAGDGYFPLASGNPDLLTAPGAVIIAVFPVLQLLEHGQILAVFQIALIGVVGQGPKNSPAHKQIGNSGKAEIHCRNSEKQGEDTDDKPQAQNGHIEFISTISARHEMLHSHLEFTAQIMKPIAHNNPLTR